MGGKIDDIKILATLLKPTSGHCVRSPAFETF